MRLLMATAAHGDTARPVAERLDGAVAAPSAHGTIASSLAIPFAAQVVQEATGRRGGLCEQGACSGRQTALRMEFHSSSFVARLNYQ